MQRSTRLSWCIPVVSRKRKEGRDDISEVPFTHILIANSLLIVTVECESPRHPALFGTVRRNPDLVLVQIK